MRRCLRSKVRSTRISSSFIEGFLCTLCTGFPVLFESPGRGEDVNGMPELFESVLGQASRGWTYVNDDVVAVYTDFEPTSAVAFSVCESCWWALATGSIVVKSLGSSECVCDFSSVTGTVKYEVSFVVEHPPWGDGDVVHTLFRLFVVLFLLDFVAP